MSRIVFSDHALTQAAASVRQSMLDTLPPPSRCEREFSDLFLAKMKRLLTREKLRRAARKTMQRAAMFFLVVLIGVSGWLTVDAQARETFFSWVREVYEEHIVYRFFGEPTAETLPAYRITWLPEGYEEVDAHEGKAAFNALYQKGDDIMSAFVFEYVFVQDGSLKELHFGDTNYIHKTVDVNGAAVDFYFAQAPGETNSLIWFDDNNSIIFSLNGFLEESVMVHMAKSVILTNPTK